MENSANKNMLKLFILTILLVLSLSQPLTMQKLTQILKQTNNSPFVNLLMIYDSATQTGKQLEQFVPTLLQKKKHYFKVNYLDCNTDDEEVMKAFMLCTPQYRPKLPALHYTQPMLTGDAKQHQFQGALTQKSLFQFAQPLMKAFSVNLKKVKDWNSFKQKNSKVPNVIYFTDKQKLPTIYKALTTNFRKTIAFAHVNKGSQLAEYFNITKFPTVLLNGKEQIQLSKNLDQLIQKFQKFQGQQTQIQISQYQSSTQQLTSQNIQKLVYELPEHILVHIPGQDGSAHPQWKKCQENFKKMFKYYESDSLVKQLNIKQTPSIVYFPKSLAKKSVQKTIFSPKDNFRTIYDQIASMIQDFTVPLANDMQMQRLTGIPLQQGKFIAVLFHQQEISLSYRVLSNDQNYKKQIMFFRMKNPQKQIMEKFQIKKLPALYVMMNDKSKQNQQQQQQPLDPQGRHMRMNLQIAHYTGKFNYDDLTRYLNMFLQKPQRSQNSQQQQQNQKLINLIQITNKKQFNKHCQQQNCYILLIDGRQKFRQTNDNYKNQIKKFINRVNEPFVVLDAACHSEILVPLEIQLQQLPIVIYLNSKFQKFSRMIGRVQQKSLNSFISKIKSNKSPYRGYSSLNFDSKKDCIEQHTKLDSYQKGSSNQSTLNEDELEILKQIQQEQKRKKQQMDKIDKQQNKKKRKRRPKNQIDLEDL